jgi:toxin ParE1/3/4
MARYDVTDEAKDDLFEIWRYIAVHGSVGRAEQQNLRFYERFQFLAENPLIGRVRPELAPDIRSFADGTYVILYKPADYGVEIVRVVHGSRDIEALFR